jgi:hypothetical protein
MRTQLFWSLSPEYGVPQSAAEARLGCRLPAFVVLGYVLSRLGASPAMARAMPADMDRRMPTTTAFHKMNESLSRFQSLLWSTIFTNNWNSSFLITL